MQNNIVMNFANKIKRTIENHPEQRQEFLKNSGFLRENFKRLKNYTKENCNLDMVFLMLGIAENPNYTKLSFLEDDGIYDILETYELGCLLYKFKGNWDLAWKAIYTELTQTGDEYGPADRSIIKKLGLAFEELKSLFETTNENDYKNFIFNNFVRDNKGELRFIFHT